MRLSAQDLGRASTIAVKVPLVVTITDSVKRPIRMSLVAAVRRSSGNERVDSVVTDRAGRATLQVPADRVVTITALMAGEVRPRWQVVQLAPSNGALLLDVASAPSVKRTVRAVRASSPSRARVNEWIALTRDVFQRESGPLRDSLRRVAITEGEALWRARLAGLERQAVIDGLVSLQGSRVGQASAQDLLRQLDPGDAYWLSTPLPGTLLPLVQSARNLSRPMLDSAGRRALVAVADSLAADRRTRTGVADELTAVAALFAYQGGDTSGAYRRWRAIEGTRPGSSVLPALRATIAPNRPVRIGSAVPSFALPGVRPEDGRVTDRDLTSRVTLVDLWATWCGPCVAERPVMVSAWATWRARGFDIVSLGLDDSASVEQRFLSARPELTWRHGVAASPDGRARRALADRFGVLGIPRWILVDANGRVLEEQVTNLDSVLAKHLGRQ